jgi:DNA-binding NtrC family response regulator
MLSKYEKPVFVNRRLHEPQIHTLVQHDKKPGILIAEHETVSAQTLKDALLATGFAPILASDKASILRHCDEPNIKLIVLTSTVHGSDDPLELARQIRSLSKLPIIFIAKETSEELAIAALRIGVNDYFKQPCSVEDLVASIRRYIPDRLPGLAERSVNTAPSIIGDGRMIGESVAMQKVKAAIGKIASTDSNVLVTGETGTGKELVAELIHKNSPRAQQPLVCINCAAIPDTLLESELFGYERGSFTGAYSSNKGKLLFGDGGTIFLDEIGDMSPYAQAKILRVIESRELQRLGGKENVALNVRFIAATNKDLEQSVLEKTFRKDLYYRLNVASIRLPLLKERREDIPALCDYYIRTLSRHFGRHISGCTEEVAEALIRYDWPGNVRELKNVLEAAVGSFRCTGRNGRSEPCGQCSEVSSRCRQIALVDLPEQFRHCLSHVSSTSLDDRYALLSALISTKWNISKAAEKLHWSRMTIYRKISKYHIHRGESRDLINKEEKPIASSGTL